VESGGLKIKAENPYLNNISFEGQQKLSNLNGRIANKRRD
jgi:hypothetical protein